MLYFVFIFFIIFFSIKLVAVKSAIAPLFIGLIALIFSGVLPSISFASFPVARISPVIESIATTEGSLKIIPSPLRHTKIFAVPKSIPISFVLRSISFIDISFQKFSSLFFVLFHTYNASVCIIANNYMV